MGRRFTMIGKYILLLGFITLIAFFLLMGCISVKIAIAYVQAPSPQAIFTLGGNFDRERYTARFTQTHPDLEIWISSGRSPQETLPLFRRVGIPEEQVHLDYRAVDTVTNFTTLVKDFQRHQIQHLYLITSNYHMRRAKAIATVVLGSRGIVVTPVEVPSLTPSESCFRALRDSSRALLWMITGHSGASLRQLGLLHHWIEANLN